jgi:hypothetical protein
MSSAIVSKAEFAAMVGMERSTLSMMIARGAIHGPALVGSGQHAKINVEAAKDQIAKSGCVSH